MMFEKEVERVRKSLRQRLAGTQPYVSLSTILQTDTVHAAYRAFFRAEVDWWIHEERALRDTNPRFDTQRPGFADVAAALDAYYIDAARFDHEELSATIDAAVKTRLNLLCRPRTALKWFVFRGEPTRPIQEILLRLQYLHDYAYLLDGIRSWAGGRSADASQYEILSVVEFERIVEKVDNDAILDLSQRDFVAMLDPLYEFFAEANPDLPPESVPTESVIIFLDDKGAVPISQALERLLYREELTLLTRSRLLRVIDDVLATMEDGTDMRADNLDVPVVEEASAVVEEASAVVEEASAVVEEASAVVEEASAVVEEAPTVVEEAPTVVEEAPTVVEEAPTIVEEAPAVVEEAPAVVEEAPAVVEEAPAVVEEAPAVVEEAPASVTSSPDADYDPFDERLRRLHTVLDERQREKVVKRLFDKDVALYEATVGVVLRCPAWKEAVGTLDRYFAEHDVEANSAVAMEFSLAIRHTFLA